MTTAFLSTSEYVKDGGGRDSRVKDTADYKSLGRGLVEGGSRCSSIVSGDCGTVGGGGGIPKEAKVSRLDIRFGDEAGKRDTADRTDGHKSDDDARSRNGDVELSVKLQSSCNGGSKPGDRRENGEAPKGSRRLDVSNHEGQEAGHAAGMMSGMMRRDDEMAGESQGRPVRAKTMRDGRRATFANEPSYTRQRTPRAEADGDKVCAAARGSGVSRLESSPSSDSGVLSDFQSWVPMRSLIPAEDSWPQGGGVPFVNLHQAPGFAASRIFHSNASVRVDGCGCGGRDSDGSRSPRARRRSRCCPCNLRCCSGPLSNDNDLMAVLQSEGLEPLEEETRPAKRVRCGGILQFPCPNKEKCYLASLKSRMKARTAMMSTCFVIANLALMVYTSVTPDCGDASRTHLKISWYAMFPIKALIFAIVAVISCVKRLSAATERALVFSVTLIIIANSVIFASLMTDIWGVPQRREVFDNHSKLAHLLELGYVLGIVLCLCRFSVASYAYFTCLFTWFVRLIQVAIIFRVSPELAYAAVELCLLAIVFVIAFILEVTLRAFFTQWYAARAKLQKLELEQTTDHDVNAADGIFGALNHIEGIVVSTMNRLELSETGRLDMQKILSLQKKCIQLLASAGNNIHAPNIEVLQRRLAGVDDGVARALAGQVLLGYCDAPVRGPATMSRSEASNLVRMNSGPGAAKQEREESMHSYFDLTALDVSLRDASSVFLAGDQLLPIDAFDDERCASQARFCDLVDISWTRTPRSLNMLRVNCGVSWNLNFFSVNEHPDFKGRALVECGMALLLPTIGDNYTAADGQLFAKVPCSPRQLLNCLACLQAAYNDPPYHNHVHAAQVAHFVGVLTRAMGVRDANGLMLSCGESSHEALLSPRVGEFAMFLAALAHDVSHTGHSNAFHIASSSPLSILYNDNSVLENYHSCRLFQILGMPQCEVIAALDSSEYRELRRSVITLILATDMSKHFEEVSEFRSCMRSCQRDGKHSDTAATVWARVKYCVKAADLGHASMRWKDHEQWSACVVQEFVLQGDEEEARGMPRSPLCEKKRWEEVAKSQIGFLSFVVQPMFVELRSFATDPSVEVLLENLGENLRQWQRIIDVESHTSRTQPSILPP